MADMTVQEILEELEHNEGDFPREALEAAIEKQEEITPELLDVLVYAKENLEEIYEDPTYIGHIFAMFLLAQFREKRAYPLIYEFYAVPGELPAKVAPDVVTEDLGRILASVSHGDPSLMKALIEDPAVGEFVRSAGLDGILTLFVEDMLPREEAVAYFESLFHGKLEEEPTFIWSYLVHCCEKLHVSKLTPEIKQAFENNLVDPMFTDWEGIQEQLSRDREEVLEETRSDWHFTLIDDVIEELEGWACFNRPATPPAPPPSPSATEIEAERPPGAPRPAPPPTKVGRNDPCPCGSGKKYKYCCGSRR